MKNKECILSGNKNEESVEPPAPVINNTTIINESTSTIPIPQQQRQQTSYSVPLDLESLVQFSAESAKERHDACLEKHIGIFSSEEDRIRKVDEMEEERVNSRIHVKKRKLGEKPEFVYQAGDGTSYSMLHQLMKAYGKYNDTVTMDSDGEGNKSRNIAVLMVLNEVSETSMNGGGSKDFDCARREKPEFLLFSNNKKDCKKVMSAFSDIYTTDKEKNKKEWYCMLCY